MRTAHRSGEMGKVFKGMATLALGTGAARLIGIAAIPILTRLYTPADYGVLSVYVALVAGIAPVLTLRYVLAIPLPRSDATAMNLMALSAAICAVAASIVFTSLWAFGDTLLSWMSMEKLSAWWWLIALGGLFVALYEALTLWATRRRAYKDIAQTKVTQSVMGESVKIGLGLLAVKPIGLLLGHIVEQSGGITSLIVRFRSDLRRLAKCISLRRMRVSARTYRGFPAYRLPSQFLLVFSTQAPAMFSAALYGASATGQLGLALMALAIPANLIGQSVGQAFYGEIARFGKGSEKRIKQLSISVQLRLFALGLPVTLALVFLGRPVFGLMFGHEWKEAGLYASILAPYVLLQLTSAPLMQVMNVYNAQGRFLFINILRTVGLLGVYFACRTLELDEVHFVSLLGGFLFAFYLLVTWFIIHLISKRARLASLAVDQK